MKGEDDLPFDVSPDAVDKYGNGRSRQELTGIGATQVSYLNKDYSLGVSVTVGVENGASPQVALATAKIASDLKAKYPVKQEFVHVELIPFDGAGGITWSVEHSGAEANVWINSKQYTSASAMRAREYGGQKITQNALEGVMVHEWGHVRDRTPNATANKLGKKYKGVSEYGKTNGRETIAEAFTDRHFRGKDASADALAVVAQAGV